MRTSQPEREMSHTKFRIMIVDDSLDMAEMFEYVAQVEDTVLAIRKGGLSALSFLYDLDYEIHAMITDLSMPDMDGIRLTEEVRRQERLRSKAFPMEIFWFTGWTFDPNDINDPVTAASKENDVVKIYTKPMNPIEIIRDVKRILIEGKELSIREQAQA